MGPEGSDSESIEEIETLTASIDRKSQSEPKFLHEKMACVNGTTDVPCLIDTGSATCLLSESTARKLKLRLENSNTVIVGVGAGARTRVNGRITIHLAIDKAQRPQVPVFIVPDSCSTRELIVGRPWCEPPFIASVKLPDLLTFYPDDLSAMVPVISTNDTADFTSKTNAIFERTISEIAAPPETASPFERALSYEYVVQSEALTTIQQQGLLQVFKMTTLLSDYHLTKYLDYAQAWRSIESSFSRLKPLRYKFPETLRATQRFVQKMTQKLEERAKTDGTPNDIVIGKAITEKRKKKVKKMAGELAEDDSAGSSPKEEFKINIFVIVDRAVQTM